jgi:hypothetical protein
LTIDAFPFLETETTNIRAAIRMNDLPVVRVVPRNSERAMSSLVPYVTRGINVLSAYVRPAPENPNDPMHFYARAAMVAPGDNLFSMAGCELARVDAGTGAHGVLRAEFSSLYGPSAWAWQDCIRWTDTSAAITDALPFLRELLRAFHASDADWMVTASRPFHEDMATAFPGRSPEDYAKRLRNALADSPSGEIPKTAPPPHGELCGDGRLLDLTATDGKPMLHKVTRDARPFGLPSLIGKRRGVWAIFR